MLRPILPPTFATFIMALRDESYLIMMTENPISCMTTKCIPKLGRPIYIDIDGIA